MRAKFLQRHLLPAGVLQINELTLYDVWVGTYGSPVEVTTDYRKSDAVIGSSALATLKSKHFRFSSREKIQLVCVTPRLIGMWEPAMSWAVLERAKQFGLAECPDDAAFEMNMQWSLSTKGHLFAVRHIEPNFAFNWFMHTCVDITTTGIGLWHGQREIPLDTLIFFRKP